MLGRIKREDPDLFDIILWWAGCSLMILTLPVFMIVMALIARDQQPQHEPQHEPQTTTTSETDYPVFFHEPSKYARLNGPACGPVVVVIDGEEITNAQYCAWIESDREMRCTTKEEIWWLE